MFITIDGPDGTGKTTVAQGLVKRLRQMGLPAVYTSEPTDSDIGKHIRKVLRYGGKDFPRLTDLFIQDRAQHIENYICPHLAAGEIVVCDRYKYSTVCYQHLQGEPIEKLIELNRRFLSPDLSVILYVDDVDILLSRIGHRGKEKDLFESRTHLLKSIQIYKSMTEYYPKEKFKYLNSELSVSKELSDLSTLVLNCFSRATHRQVSPNLIVPALAPV